MNGVLGLGIFKNIFCFLASRVCHCLRALSQVLRNFSHKVFHKVSRSRQASHIASHKSNLSFKSLPHYQTNANKIKTKSRPAFILLDAAMGIAVCAIGFGLAFSFLHTLGPRPLYTTHNVYGALLQNPASTKASIASESSLVYDGLMQSFSAPNGESLYFFKPQTIR